MSSFCIGSISWCCFVVPLFRCSSHVLLFRRVPIVSPVFRCFAGVPVFCQCSGVPPVFRRSVFRFYSMPVLHSTDFQVMGHEEKQEYSAGYT